MARVSQLLLRRRLRLLTDRVLDRIRIPLVQHGNRRECTVCGWTGARFLPYGSGPSRRSESRCPSCRSKERHRFASLLLAEVEVVGRVLHVASEPQTARLLKARSDHYTSIDLRPGLAMEVEDLTALSYGDGSFSMIFYSHVLEHIPNDRAAIAEMHRVVSSDGVVIVLVPLEGEVTDEEQIDDPAERLRRYGLEDHVRMYGLDVIGRLESCFSVEHRVTSERRPEERRRWGLGTDEHAFICRPRPSAV